MKKNIPLVKLNNSGVLREKKWLVKGISLEIYREQIVTLMAQMVLVKLLQLKLF